MKKWAVAATAALLLLSGCSEKEKASGPKEPVKEVEDIVEEEETLDLPYQFPLTGVGSEINTGGRAIAVMVNNHPAARPQSGLNKADIVYEVLAEGDITRFLAVFQSEKPEKIGPVRSARDYYIELAKGLNALYITHGSSKEAENMLRKGYIDNLDGMIYDGILFKRASFRKAPHNSYITYKNVKKGAEQNNYAMDQTPPSFTFLEEENKDNIQGDQASSVNIYYSPSGISDSSFEFDKESGKYKRFSGDELTIDLDSKEPILLDNIFIIETQHRIEDEVGHKEIDLVSGGSGYLLQNGKVMEVEWENDNGVIVPVRNGEVVPFVQGKTWVNVVPTNPGLQSSVSFNVK